MAKTDNPLKQLITMAISDVAAWLLHTEVRAAVVANIELSTSPDPIISDQVFHITLADGRTVLLHIEFQGRRSHKPMHLRMLDYMARLVDYYRPTLMYHVVIYVGHGAGRHDTGGYQIHMPDGSISLAWTYQVIRLWQLDAEDLLATRRPALLALVGQTIIRDPATVLPRVIASFKTVPDPEVQHRLLTTFLALVHDKEILAMAEHLIDDDDFELDTVGMRWLEARGQKWMEQIIEQRVAEGRQEGIFAARCRDILDVLRVRLGLDDATQALISTDLSTLTDEERLHALFLAALQVESLAAFQATLAEQLQHNGLK